MIEALAALESRPGAPHTLWIDTEGSSSIKWTSTRIVTTPPYAINGVFAVTPERIAAIEEIFALVSEDFAPFAVNVVLQPPAGTHPMRICVGGLGEWWFGGLGVSQVGTYGEDRFPDVAFVFSDHVQGHPKTVGDAISHEAGHAYGLLHNVDANGGQAIGTNRLSPIMGFNSGSDRATWSVGLNDAGVIQDDMAKLGSVLGFVSDDAPDLWANPITVSGHFEGLINSPMDRDQYRFYASGPTRITLEIPPHNNLSAGLELRTEGAMLIKRLNEVTDTTTIEKTLAPGWYRLTIGTSPREAGNVGRYGVTIESGEVVVLLGDRK